MERWQLSDGLEGVYLEEEHAREPSSARRSRHTRRKERDHRSRHCKRHRDGEDQRASCAKQKPVDCEQTKPIVTDTDEDVHQPKKFCNSSCGFTNTNSTIVGSEDKPSQRRQDLADLSAREDGVIDSRRRSGRQTRWGPALQLEASTSGRVDAEGHFEPPRDFSLLPHDALHIILKQLNRSSLAAASSTCTTWRCVADSLLNAMKLRRYGRVYKYQRSGKQAGTSARDPLIFAKAMRCFEIAARAGVDARWSISKMVLNFDFLKIIQSNPQRRYYCSRESTVTSFPLTATSSQQDVLQQRQTPVCCIGSKGTGRQR
eukprot:4608241-Pyramimonas_sp.AAC.3